MVEHNLAKVGVASSNLVSRSIVFIFLLFIPLLSYSKQHIIIKQRYCIKNNQLTLKDIYPQSRKNRTILAVSTSLSSYKVPSLDLISNIKKYLSLPVKDNSGGIVTLDKQCYIKYEKNKIKQTLRSIFKKRYKSIRIVKLQITPINPFPNDFDDYTFDSINIKEYNLRKKSSSFIVVYKNSRGRKLRIFFKYNILAKISLFKAKHNIRSGKILFRNDFEKNEVKFDKIPSNFIEDLKNRVYIAKNYIRQGSILTRYLIKKATLVKKKDTLRSIIKDGSLQVEFFSKALQDGNMGDIIKTIGNNGKIYKAKIVGKGLVVIQ